jgi:pimeloyl-ACP methyl ester carboxylesterase
LSAVVLLAVTAACSRLGVDETAGASQAPSPPPPITGSVRVGAYSLSYECQGFGSPTVILEAGLALGGIEEFRTFLPKVASMTRVCTYDRAGVGSSDRRPEAGPVKGAQLAREVHLLFAGIGINPPYILVGHSFGGLLVRGQAATYPGDAAGMVLIDSVSEGEVNYLRSIGINPWVDQTSRVDMTSLLIVLDRAPPLGDIPLVVITAGVQENPWRADGPARDAGFQDALAALTSDSIHVTATDAGTFVQDSDPALVVAAIREVLHSARQGSRLPPCPEVFPPLGGTCS